MSLPVKTIVVAPPSPGRLSIQSAPVVNVTRPGVVFLNHRINSVTPVTTPIIGGTPPTNHLLGPLPGGPVTISWPPTSNPGPPINNPGPSSRNVTVPFSPRLATSSTVMRPPLIKLSPRAPTVVSGSSRVLSVPIVSSVVPTSSNFSNSTVLPAPVFFPTSGISPIVVTPKTTVVTPGALGRIPGFGSTVTTPIVIPSINASGTPIVLPSATITSETRTIEENLAEKGYIVTDKIFVRTPPSGIVPQYMKAKNNFGQTVFIELDSEGDVVYESENQTMVVSQNASMVPVSKQIGIYECSLSGGACGVAFDCEGEVCTLTKSIDSPNQPTRLVLTTTTKPTEKSLSLSGSPIAYPVVRYSDIMSDQLSTAAAIEKSTSSISNARYQECKEDWNDFRKATAEMNAAAGEFSRASDMILNRVASDMRTLKSYRAFYVQSPPKTELAEAKFQSVVYNINNRHESLIALFAICNVVPISTQALKEQAEALKQSTKNLRDVFQDLGTVVTGSTIPKVSQSI